MQKNKLFYGDNLDNLRRKIKDETVDLCYIDPPFNSKRNYNQIYNNIGGEDRAQAQAFIDTWIWDEHAIAGHDEIISNARGRFQPQLVELMKGLHAVLGEGSLLAYLVSMALRVTEIHRVLKPTGSFYLHCDPTSSHYLKLVLDAVFCGGGGGTFATRLFGATRAAVFQNDTSLRNMTPSFSISKARITNSTRNIEPILKEQCSAASPP